MSAQNDELYYDGEPDDSAPPVIPDKYSGTAVNITKRGLVVRIDPAIPPVIACTAAAATQKRRVYVQVGRNRGPRRYETVEEPLFSLRTDAATKQQYIMTYAGILPRLAKTYKSAGLVLNAVDAGTGMPHFEPKYEALDQVTLRDGQMRMLKVVFGHERAQLDAVTGGGKTFFVRVMSQCYAYPDCRIVIAAPGRDLMYAYLDLLRPMYRSGEVGQCGDGRKDVNARIIVSTFDSVENIEPSDKYLVFIDEVHEIGTMERLKVFSRFVRSKMFGLSGSTECRTDQANLGIEALCGPVLERVSYQEGVEQGYIAKVQTYFYLHENPTCDLEVMAARKRKTIWANAARNETIAGICKYWDKKLTEERGDAPQIVVLVETVEHMFYLKRLLPEYTLVYNGLSDKLFSRLNKLGLIPRGFVPINPRIKQQLRRDAENGVERKLMFIGRSGGTGIDFRHLDVLVRADGGQSEVSNIQYRGRSTRGSFGIYADIADTGPNELMRAKSRRRFKSCRDAGWDPVVIDLWSGHKEVVGYGSRKAGKTRGSG